MLAMRTVRHEWAGASPCGTRSAEVFGPVSGNSRAMTQHRLRCAGLRAVRMHMHHIICEARESSGQVHHDHGIWDCSVRRENAPSAEHAQVVMSRMQGPKVRHAGVCGRGMPWVRLAELHRGRGGRSCLRAGPCSASTGAAPAVPRSQAGLQSRACWASQVGCGRRRPARLLCSAPRRAPCALARPAC